MTDESEIRKGRTRSRLISHCQEQCFQARSNYHRAAAIQGDEAAMARAAAELHAAVMDYYESIKPLRDDDNIADEWEDTDLWSYTVPQINTQTGEIVDYKEKSVGLDDLGEFAAQTTTRTETVTGLLGKRDQTVTEPDRLPPDTLLDILDTLDDLAADLGFAPETPRHEPETEVMLEDLEEIEEKWAGETDALENIQNGHDDTEAETEVDR